MRIRRKPHVRSCHLRSTANVDSNKFSEPEDKNLEDEGRNSDDGRADHVSYLDVILKVWTELDDLSG